MARFTVTKQGYEHFPISAQFSNRMDVAGGETIASETVTAIDVNDNDATAIVLANPQNDGASAVVFSVRAGTEDDSPYKITVRCVTSAGNQFETDIFLTVREV